MRLFHKNNIIKKNQIRDEKQYQELKEEYKNKTLFYLDCKDSLSFLKKHYKNKEIIVTLSLIHISEPTRLRQLSRMPSSA